MSYVMYKREDANGWQFPKPIGLPYDITPKGQRITLGIWI